MTTKLELNSGTTAIDQNHAPVSLTFTFLLEDFVALSKAAALNGRSRGLHWLKSFALITIAVPFGIMIAVLWLHGWASLELFRRASFWWGVLKIYSLIILLIVPICFLVQRTQWRLIFKKRSIANKNITPSFNDDGLHSVAAGFEGKAGWDVIKRVSSSKTHLILFISESEGFVIPRRAFQSNEAFENFATYAKERANGQAH
jgi:hypothetical protein